MRIPVPEFWRMTLAEWRVALDGHAAREQKEMRRLAWALSYQLVAAGCDADKVSIAKLLGEKEPRTRRRALTPEMQRKRSAEIIWQRIERERAKKGGE